MRKRAESGPVEASAARGGSPIPAGAFLCMQCRKCTAGCPVADTTDMPIADVIGWLRAGDLDRALNAGAIWDCLGCHACSSRCPSGANPAEMLDALRLLAIAAGITPPRRVKTFHKAFLRFVRRKGRADEGGMMLRFYLRHGFTRSDILKGLALYRKGRVRAFGKKIRNRGEVKRIFRIEPPAREEDTGSRAGSP